MKIVKTIPNQSVWLYDTDNRGLMLPLREIPQGLVPLHDVLNTLLKYYPNKGHSIHWGFNEAKYYILMYAMQYNIRKLIAKLKEREYHLETVIKNGFKSPHCYRGDFNCVAFEPAENITVGEMIAAAESVLLNTYYSIKGDEHTYTLETPVYIAYQDEEGMEMDSTVFDEMFPL